MLRSVKDRPIQITWYHEPCYERWEKAKKKNSEPEKSQGETQAIENGEIPAIKNEDEDRSRSRGRRSSIEEQKGNNQIVSSRRSGASESASMQTVWSKEKTDLPSNSTNGTLEQIANIPPEGIKILVKTINGFSQTPIKPPGLEEESANVDAAIDGKFKNLAEDSGKENF